MNLALIIVQVIFIYSSLCSLVKNQSNLSQIISSNADTIHTALLHGGVDIGYYFVNIYIGTPPKKQTVIVDTGSSVTTFPCNDCSDCGDHIDQKFDYGKSNSAQVVKCHEQVGQNQCGQCDEKQRCSFSISFAEGSSLKGYFIKDYILFGDSLYELYQEAQELLVSNEQRNEDQSIINREHFKTVFGCTTKETNLFRTQQADGIMGLSPLTNTQHNLPNVVDDLFSQFNKKGQNLSFSLCYNSTVGGYMTIGGYDKHRHEQNVITHTIPYYKERNLFRIKITDVKIGNLSLGLDSSQYDLGQGSFVDSGTTLVYAHPAIFNAFQSTLNTHCNQQDINCPIMEMIAGQQCFKYTKSLGSRQDFFKKFPIIYFDLENNFIFDWKPSDYLYIETSLTQEKDMYCFPLNQYTDRFILGGVWMRSWDILFDRQAQQLQFTRSKCSNSKVHTRPKNFPEQNTQNNTGSLLDFNKSRNNEISSIYAILGVFSISLIICCSLFLLRIFILRRRNNQKIIYELPLPEIEYQQDQNYINIGVTLHNDEKTQKILNQAI